MELLTNAPRNQVTALRSTKASRLAKLTVGDIAYYACLLLVLSYSTKDFLRVLVPWLPVNTLFVLLSLLVIALGFLDLRRLNPYSLVCLIVVEGIAILSLAFSANSMQSEYIKQLFFSISSLLSTFVYIIAFARVRNPAKVRKHLLIIGAITLVVIFAATMSGRYGNEVRSLNYLGVGIGSSIWVAFFIQEAFSETKSKRIPYAVIAIVFSLMVAIYGNRGAFVALVVFTLYCVMHHLEFKGKLIIFALICIVIVSFSMFEAEFNRLLSAIVSSNGIYSRNFTIASNNSLLYNTRDLIWSNSINALENHWLVGYGLAYDRVIGGGFDLYAHNFVIELWMIFGIIPGSLLAIAHISCGIWVCFKIDDDSWSQLFAPFFVVSTTILLFNNSILTLSAFWGAYGVLFAYLNSRRIKAPRMAFENPR